MSEPVALMALYTVLLVIASGGAGLCFGRWLGERNGREAAMRDAAVWRAIERRCASEARGEIFSVCQSTEAGGLN